MSLYRKYRPQTFEDVVGQDHVAQTLRNALTAVPPRVAHAYLFCGPRGIGKTTNARLMAKCLNCEKGPTPTPCNECDFCVRVSNNETLMDLLEIDAASHTGVDAVREMILEKLDTRPAQGRYRIYIIDEVHMLSPSSFNALLKTLEEPPSHAIFILATTDAHKVPATVASRCQQFNFRRVGPVDIAARLQYVAKCENIALEDGAARLIAHAADGALRDALTLLEQVTAFSGDSVAEADVRLVLGTISQDLLMTLVDAVGGGDAVAALDAIERATEEGVAFPQLVRDLVSYARDALLLTVGYENDHLEAADRKRRASHAQGMGRTRLLRFVEALRAAEKDMKTSNDHRLLLELVLVRAASNEMEAPAALGPPTAGAVPMVAPAKMAPMAAPRARETVQAPPAAQAVPIAPSAPAIPPVPVMAQSIDGTAETHRAPEPRDEAIATPVETASVAPVNTSPVVAETAALETPVVQVPAEEMESQPGAMPDAAAPDAIAPDAAAPDAALPAASEERMTKQRGRRIHTLEEFIELWPAVLVRVRRKIGVTAVAYLHDAMPVALDDSEAVVAFKKEFHYAKACEAAKRLPFEQVLNECMAMPHRLKFVHTPPVKPAEVVAETASTPATDDDDEEAEDDVLNYAQNIFAAEVMGRSGLG